MHFPYRYYYSPITKRLGNSIVVKLLGSAVTFTFIFLWHGIKYYIFWWSILNFFGITLEATARAVGDMPKYQRIERLLLSPRGRRRFYCVLGAPLFLMSILSNFYFFMGKDLGDVFWTRSWGSWPLGTPVILLAMYCGAQTSFEMKNWEIRGHLIRGHS